jgi:aryl-alcohol dehydrogenase-like predicted oxidoreductase
LQDINEAEGIASVHEAFKLGINFFDSSPFYGSTKSETVRCLLQLQMVVVVQMVVVMQVQMQMQMVVAEWLEAQPGSCLQENCLGSSSSSMAGQHTSSIAAGIC